MTPSALPWVADGLTLFGLLVLTLAVFGMVRLPDVYTRTHAASTAVVLGVGPFLAAAVFVGDGPLTSRAVLVAAVLLLTTPVSAHVIARSAHRSREPMRTEQATDESGVR